MTMNKPEPTQADREEAQRIWDEGHDKIAGQAADASSVAEQAHVETLAAYIAAWNQRPAQAGNATADTETLTYMREIAQGMGYPSVLEALEHLSDLRQPVDAIDAEGVDDWTVPHAYVGLAYKETETTDLDGGPLWTVPIECAGGDAQLADVCGGSEREALVRAQAICRALQGPHGEIDAEVVRHVERLFRSDNEEDWLAAEALQHWSRTPSPEKAEIERLIGRRKDRA